MRKIPDRTEFYKACLDEMNTETKPKIKERVSGYLSKLVEAHPTLAYAKNGISNFVNNHKSLKHGVESVSAAIPYLKIVGVAGLIGSAAAAHVSTDQYMKLTHPDAVVDSDNIMHWNDTVKYTNPANITLDGDNITLIGEVNNVSGMGKWNGSGSDAIVKLSARNVSGAGYFGPFDINGTMAANVTDLQLQNMSFSAPVNLTLNGGFIGSMPGANVYGNITMSGSEFKNFVQNSKIEGNGTIHYGNGDVPLEFLASLNLSAINDTDMLTLSLQGAYVNATNFSGLFDNARVTGYVNATQFTGVATNGKMNGMFNGHSNGGYMAITNLTADLEGLVEKFNLSGDMNITDLSGNVSLRGAGSILGTVQLPDAKIPKSMNLWAYQIPADIGLPALLGLGALSYNGKRKMKENIETSLSNQRDLERQTYILMAKNDEILSKNDKLQSDNDNLNKKLEEILHKLNEKPKGWTDLDKKITEGSYIPTEGNKPTDTKDNKTKD